MAYYHLTTGNKLISGTGDTHEGKKLSFFTADNSAGLFEQQSNLRTMCEHCIDVVLRSFGMARHDLPDYFPSYDQYDFMYIDVDENGIQFIYTKDGETWGTKNVPLMYSSLTKYKDIKNVHYERLLNEAAEQLKYYQSIVNNIVFSTRKQLYYEIWKFMRALRMKKSSHENAKQAFYLGNAHPKNVVYWRAEYKSFRDTLSITLTCKDETTSLTVPALPDLKEAKEYWDSYLSREYSFDEKNTEILLALKYINTMFVNKSYRTITHNRHTGKSTIDIEFELPNLRLVYTQDPMTDPEDYEINTYNGEVKKDGKPHRFPFNTLSVLKALIGEPN